MDDKDRERMMKRLETSRKDRVSKLLEKIRSGEYSKEAKSDARQIKDEAYETLAPEDKEKLAEKEKKRREKEYYGD